jgi:16S rRNA (cytosine1402-N4)-methyltransferase
VEPAGHVAVLLAEVLEHLRPQPGQTFVDGTAGGGGHAAAILERIRPGGRLVLLDRDRSTLERLIARFGRRGDVRYFHANFCDVDQALAAANVDRVDGAILDLGLSSLQLDTPDRGFSHDRPGPLDMRFNVEDPSTAEEIVNRWPADRLAALFRDYGDQPFSRRIAAAIVEARRRAPLRRTDELAAIVSAAVPAEWKRKERIHPATRVFQALRMAVNDEIGSLETFLDKIFGLLRPGGRLAIIAFHSGEDRIVKHRFREAASAGHVALPFTRPVTPAPEEVAANPRSRSSRLRVAVRLPAAG